MMESDVRQELFFEREAALEPYAGALIRRYRRIVFRKEEMAGYGKLLSDIANNHLYYGVHREEDRWVFRELAPRAEALWVIGDFTGWKRSDEFKMVPVGNGSWELSLPADRVHHGDLFKWYVRWSGGEGERIPVYARRCVQDERTKLFAAQVWAPKDPYRWRSQGRIRVANPLIYEAHIGMSGESPGVAGFGYFTRNVLPEIADLGYNTVQLMGLQEHPYYGSFGYQVSGFFALSSRFGTPEEFKELVDTAHSLGIAVIMDMVHSHAVKNETEGPGRIDGSDNLYFRPSPGGDHPAWGTRCFDYGKDETLYFLLSDCKYWLEEYRLDGFRFDGVTSMLYKDHGLGRSFSGYKDYFDGNQDEDAITYLGLANIVIREVNPEAFTVAEEMSGLPGLAVPLDQGGIGFDFRLSMGIPDLWIKWIKELPDERWNVEELYCRLVEKRSDERTVSYAESHDQALVGDKTILFRLADKEMYTRMNIGSPSMIIDRGVALHKMIRLVTLATAGDGYLNFMGNEFGHPEWIDFPREGNGWSYHYARRQWSLRDNPLLRYGRLRDFDQAMIRLVRRNEILRSAPVSVLNDRERQVMAFERSGYLFVFNFNPVRSFENFRIEAAPGTYGTVLDSDWKEFDGFGRNDRNLPHFTIREEAGERVADRLSLYLPSRTALVLKRI